MRVAVKLKEKLPFKQVTNFLKKKFDFQTSNVLINPFLPFVREGGFSFTIAVSKALKP
jgi:hypothetical protein